MKLLVGILIVLAMYFASLNPANAQDVVSCNDAGGQGALI
jgi:hypothetical protein